MRNKERERGRFSFEAQIEQSSAEP